MIEPSQATFGSALVRWSCLVLLPFVGGCDSDAADMPDDGVPAASSVPEVAPAAFTIRGRQADPLNLTYAIAAHGPADADRALLAAVEAAAAEWSKSPLIQFRAAYEGDVATVTFSWERGQHADCQPFGIDGSIAHTGPMGDAMFVHLDAGREWGADGESMFVAALHELGHVLGLGHSNDSDSVMARDERHTTIRSMDWAGIHSLYGSATTAPGSLAIQHQLDDGTWSPIGMVEGVAPFPGTHWSLFDTEGDGTDELLVWRMGGIRPGDLMIYVFEPSPDGSGPRLAKTRGPFLGVARGGEVYVESLEDGRRFFSTKRYEPGNSNPVIRVWRFSDTGGLVKASPREVVEREAAHAGLDAYPSSHFEGDLDGDGILEQIQSLP